MEIHGSAGWVSRRGELPSSRELDFPSSKYAERFYRLGRPFLMDYLPFWVAGSMDRLLLIFLPIIIILLPVLGNIPSLYGWRRRLRLNRWYGEFKNLELERSDDPGDGKIIEYRRRLDQIEFSINSLRVPAAFFGEVYRFKELSSWFEGSSFERLFMR